MIKELFKINDKRYFEGDKNNQKIIFTVFEFSKSYTVEEIEKALNDADLPSYLKDKYTIEEMTKEPLNNLFQLDIYDWGCSLNPMNYNLYEFERIIQGNEKAKDSLKSACICKGRESNYFYIALEEYDYTSRLTRENRQYIDKYLYFKTSLLEKILNCNCSHVESY